MSARLAAAVLTLLTTVAPAAAQRVELPVRLVTLSDGTRRFGVPLTIDGKAVEAGLDTGSTGLRVMARALPPGGDGAAVRYGYGAGTQLEGPRQPVMLGLGALAGKVTVQRVERLSCSVRRPDCPVTRNGDPATFGILGDGLPDQGFAAILGVNLHPAGVPNPFEALGVRRWIVELPRPDDAGPGRIILNPSDADLADYARHRLLDDDDSVAACLSGPAPLGRFCAPATIDSGAPGIVLFGAGRRAPGRSIPLTMAIGDDGDATSANLPSDRRDRASRLTLADLGERRGPSMHLGIAPYWIWSVFYDADAHVIGLKPR